MSTKIRKQIYIQPRQEHLLKAIAQQTGISEAEIIRQAIDLHLSEITVPQTDISLWETEREFIEHIKTRPVQAGGRDWKREDLYER
ncbi:ribbon-helix-helix domain-containing protein [Sphaerospermopsis sp. LEGE 08334]|uniref:ribbon-helix-helix domain-containing protein n=1 Tax=Sphaerospermopsis sp. LEGE 08334 TaxID=1828651 RepID=UPI0018804F15|nr:ribbon-helix-helix domain-containing protein [Sphaerospermopsis sp. LEGE 08334]MBE9054872.1 ribbon-helix-helix domain-containing protein [Sphaerospermopsis sp. LEGE 08334]